MVWFPSLGGLEAMESLPQPNPNHAPPPSDIPTTLYCVACDCSERARPGTACWLCGGETTWRKPVPPWPPSITGPTMYASTNPEEEAA